jgi:thiol-disulfide isomerase/thioredoxin
MNRISGALLAATLVACRLEAHDGPGIFLEDPAPAVHVGKWFKGTPVDHFEPGTVYVVEFWSTWSAPSKESFPLLTRIAHAYTNQARVFAVSVFERENQDDAARFGKIDSFVKEQGGQMDFAVAADASRFFMAQNWMWVADEYDLPTVFVIDKDGRIAWIGRPEKNLEGIVAKIVAGTFDRKAAHDELDARRSLRRKDQADLKQLSDLWQAKKYSEALAAIDRLATEKPSYKSGLIPFRFNLLLEADETAAYAYARELAAGEYRDQPDNLDGMARGICQAPGLKHPDYALAMELAKTACALTKETNPRHLATLAEVYYRRREFDRAIAAAEQALALAKKQPGLGATAEDLQSRLEQFKAARNKS